MQCNVRKNRVIFFADGKTKPAVVRQARLTKVLKTHMYKYPIKMP